MIYHDPICQGNFGTFKKVLRQIQAKSWNTAVFTGRFTLAQSFFDRGRGLFWSARVTEARLAPERWTGRKSAGRCPARPTPSTGTRGTGDISPMTTRGCGLSGNSSGLHQDMVLSSRMGKTKEDIRMTKQKLFYSKQDLRIEIVY